MTPTNPPWMKLYTDFLNDPLIGRLSDQLKLRFIQLLLVAGECNADGYLVDGDRPLTVEDLAWRLHLDPDQHAEELDQLIKAKLISSEDGVYLIINFSKRQGLGNKHKRLAWREAKRRQRKSDPEPETGPPSFQPSPEKLEAYKHLAQCSDQEFMDIVTGVGNSKLPLEPIEGVKNVREVSSEDKNNVREMSSEDKKDVREMSSEDKKDVLNLSSEDKNSVLEMSSEDNADNSSSGITPETANSPPAEPNPSPKITQEAESECESDKYLNIKDLNKLKDSSLNPESQPESKIVPETVSPKNKSSPPASPALETFRKFYPSGRLNRAQKATLESLASEHGLPRLAESLEWAANTGIAPGRAVQAIKTALPKWQSKDSSLSPLAGVLPSQGLTGKTPESLTHEDASTIADLEYLRLNPYGSGRQAALDRLAAKGIKLDDSGIHLDSPPPDT